MECRVRELAEAAILDLDGRLTLGEGCGALRDNLRATVAKGYRRILINLHGVSYIDSAGLGELVGSYATVTNQGGQLKLLNVQDKVHDLLQITKLITVFQTYTDEADAVRSFRPTAAAAKG